MRFLAVVASTAILAACADDHSVNPLLSSPAVGSRAVPVGATTASLTSAYTVRVGEQISIKPTSMRANRMRWATANAAVATVNGNGIVTGIGVGNTTITATSGSVVEQFAVTVVTNATLTSFVVAPESGTTLEPGQTRQFTTTATWSDLQSHPVSVTYSATGGTITSGGLFTAGNLAGTFLVIATCNGGLADTAFVQVAPAAAQLVSLRIDPRAVTLSAGTTQQFTTTALWSTGATTLPPLTYSASGGTVSSTGLYTAPGAAGTYQVIVAHSGGSARDTATVTVTGSTPISTPALSPFFTDNFDNGQRNSANGFRWLGSIEPTISSERAFSGSYAMRFQYNPTPPGGQAWSEERFDMGRYLSEVAVEYMIYVPANYKHRAVPNDGPTNNKFLMMWRDVYGGDKGTWELGVEWWRTTDYESSGRFMSSSWAYNWTGSLHEPGLYRLIGADAPMKPGQWNRIRFYVKAASARGASDGVMRFWVNNTLVFVKTDGTFFNYDPNMPDATLRNGYLMGYANSGFDELTVFYIDDVRFYAGNPGWQ